MSTDIRSLFRRRRAREPMSVDELIADVSRAGSPNTMEVRTGELDVPQGQMLTPQNQQAITRPRRATMQGPAREPSFEEFYSTRPRSVMDTVRQAVTQQPVPQAEPSMRNDTPEATRDRRTQPRDYIADDEAYLRDLENKKDPFWKRAVIAGINAAQAGFGQQPTPIQTPRQMEILKTQNRLGRTTKMAGERARIEQGQMVPVTLDNGEVVNVPARTAGTLRSRQQEIDMRGEKQGAQIKRWEGMTARDRRRDIAGLYKSGALNTPEGLEYAAKELDIPVTMMPAFIAGQMRDAVDTEGNLVEINRQTGAVTPTGTKSYETVKEAGRERRAQASQAGAMARTQASQAGANQRAGMRGGRGATTDKTALRRAANLAGEVERVRKKLEAYDARTPANERDESRRKAIANEAAPAITELNNLGAGYKASMEGKGGYPYAEKASGGGNEDPKVRKYANQFFGGDYAAAEAAIKQQRGQ